MVYGAPVVQPAQGSGSSLQVDSASSIRRHPAEIPLLIVGIVALLIAIPIVSWVVAEELGPWWTSVILGAVASLYVGRGLLNAQERATSVLITEDQFPEIHQRIVHFAERFGLESVPDAYVVQEGGNLNAFASKHIRTNFIRINADVLEVGTFGLGPRPKDPDALDFIVAHEVGHVAARHVTYWYTIISSFIAYIPLLGAALSRAKEYTADNYGYAVAPGGIRAMVMLSGGKYLYPDVDPAHFAERARTDSGLFLWVFNAISSHPILTKRIAALEDRSRPGRIL